MEANIQYYAASNSLPPLNVKSKLAHKALVIGCLHPEWDYTRFVVVENRFVPLLEVDKEKKIEDFKYKLLLNFQTSQG